MDKDQVSNAWLILPNYLQELGYKKFECIKALNDRSFIIDKEMIRFYLKWFTWNGIFEYMSCVEHARSILNNLPTGKAIGAKDCFSAKYNSVSLVFFAQATLDNIAFWISKNYPIKSRGSKLAFHEKKFMEELKAIDPKFNSIFVTHDKYINMLREFRMEWVHRITGGANDYSDKNPSDPSCKTIIAVPIDPKINMYDLGHKDIYRKIEECKALNDGEWLYPIDKFSDIIANGTRDILIDTLSIVLGLIPST